jgi:hypothetical protein
MIRHIQRLGLRAQICFRFSVDVSRRPGSTFIKPPGEHVCVLPPCKMTQDFWLHDQEWFDIFVIGSNLLVVQVFLLEVRPAWDHLLYRVNVSNSHARLFPGGARIQSVQCRQPGSL